MNATFSLSGEELGLNKAEEDFARTKTKFYGCRYKNVTGTLRAARRSFEDEKEYTGAVVMISFAVDEARNR